MKYPALILIAFILPVSCDKDNDSNDIDRTFKKPDIPVNVSLDVNTDQVSDFVISYKELATDDLPSSGGSIIGTVIPMNQNRLLYRGQVGYLFLNINDTIRKSHNTNSNWIGNGADVISINRDLQKWDRTWIILSAQKSYYFLAFKLILNNSEKIGWFCLEFDIKTGAISISDGDISDDDELIIQKRVVN